MAWLRVATFFTFFPLRPLSFDNGGAPIDSLMFSYSWLMLWTLERSLVFFVARRYLSFAVSVVCVLRCPLQGRRLRLESSTTASSPNGPGCTCVDVGRVLAEPCAGIGTEDCFTRASVPGLRNEATAAPLLSSVESGLLVESDSPAESTSSPREPAANIASNTCKPCASAAYLHLLIQFRLHVLIIEARTYTLIMWQTSLHFSHVGIAWYAWQALHSTEKAS